MKLTYLLRRQDSNLRPSPYESVMQPSTPRRGLKNPHILTDLEEHSKNEFHQSSYLTLYKIWKKEQPMRESNSRWQVQSLPFYRYILAF